VIQPHPGVVDEDVEPAEALRRLADEGRGLRFALHVRFHEHDVATARRDVRRDPLGPLGVAIGEHHLGPFRHEPSHRRLADPRSPAAHGGHLPVQSCHVR
jgi:hypothetical protein